MTFNRRRPEEGRRTDDNEPQPNLLSSTSTDELPGVSSLARKTMEVMILQTLQRYVGPIIMPLIGQIVKEQIESVKQEILATLKEYMNQTNTNREITNVPKKLKLQFKNKVSLPVYTGKPLLGDNGTNIEIVLVDAITGEIVKTGPESMAKVEIVGFWAGDTENESNDDNWTFDDFHKRIMSEKKGKRTLQGKTCLQLKEGVCCFVNTISFTHNAENIRNGWYKLGVGVVDADLMNRVDVATTEAFFMKDRRALYSKKHSQPSIFDKVHHLEQGNHCKTLEDAGVIYVKDFLTLLYTDQKRLEKILNLKPTSSVWESIVKNAQASNGMFLYLDPSNGQKTGVVLDVKLQLKALILEPRQYVPVNHLSDKQKVDSQNLVKVARDHVEMLKAFKNEALVKEHLLESLNELNNSTPPLLSGLTETLNDLHNSNPSPTLTSQSERGKEALSFDNEMIYATTYHQEHISFHQPNIYNTNGLNFGTASEPGTSSQTGGPSMDSSGLTNIFSQCPDILAELAPFMSSDYITQIPNKEWQCSPTSSDISQAVSVCTAQTRWTTVYITLKVYNLLKRNSVRKRISLLEGAQPLKKHKCF